MCKRQETCVRRADVIINCEDSPVNLSSFTVGTREMPLDNYPMSISSSSYILMSG